MNAVAPTPPVSAVSPASTAIETPPFPLPLRHFAFSTVAFWLFAAAFAQGQGRLLGFDFQARWVLGLVHLLTLGFITMTMLGAMIQMMPVLWRVPLGSSRPMVAAGWWLLAVGIAGFVGHLWAGSEEYWIPATFLIAAVCVYLYVLIRTMTAVAAPDWVTLHLAFAVGYFALLAAMGILLTFDRQRGILFHDPGGALIAHVHLALIGWVSLTIFGVSYRLVSMFSLSHYASRTPGLLAFILTNVGLVGLALDGLFGGRRLMPVWAVMLAVAFASYAFQMKTIFEARNRRLDPSLSFTILALAGGTVWVGLGLALAFGWLRDSTETRAAYVCAALLGWVTPYILGQMHKIVPFLVWMHVYSPRKGARPAPAPKMQELTNEPLSWAGLCFLAGALPAVVGGFLWESSILLRVGSLLLLLTATAHGVNTGMAFSHLFRKRPS